MFSYRVTCDQHYFQRSETCKITQRNVNGNIDSEFFCFGSTKYHRIDEYSTIENITNYDKYKYSSLGFEHIFYEFEKGEYSRIYDTFEFTNIVPTEINLQKREQDPIEKKLEYKRNGNDELLVM